MSTRAQQAQMLDDVAFKLQVKGALLAASASVLNEATSAPNHANRHKWANAIYANPQAQTEFFLPGMLTNPTIAAAAGGPGGASGTAIPDSDVDFVVASLFDKYATQYAEQQNFGAFLSLGT